MEHLDGLTRPRLRPLEPVLFEHEGARRVAFRDPAGLASAIDVPHAIAVLLTLFDGQRDAAAIAAQWLTMSGEALPDGFVARIVDQLDEHLLLDTPRFRAAYQQALAEFRAQGTRPMAHAPDGYPDDPAACAAYLAELLARGRAESRSLGQGPVKGVLAPHIDLHRGGVCYGAAYDALRDSTADLFVVLGIAHSSCCWPEPPPLAIATRLNYATPFGAVETDQSFLDAMAVAYDDAGGNSDDLFRDELVHRGEHSLEFQLLWLDYLHGHRPFRAVPLLLGSLHPFYDDPAEVDGDDGLGPLLDALYAAMAAYEGEVCVVAGCDWSHVGTHFGDDDPVDEARVEAVVAADSTALGPLVQGDLAEFFQTFACDGNARNVCSVSNLYALRALLPEAEMELLRYEVAFDPEQTVSFAAAVLR